MRTLLALLLLCSAAAAQQTLVPTRPFGDSTNAAASTAFVQSAFTNQKFVQCSNTTTDAAAINSAISSVGVIGPGTVWFSGPCNINTTINIGNGTSSNGSTIQGVILAGMGNPTALLSFGGYTKPSGSTLNWTGSASTGIVAINGPLQGWGLQHAYLDCNNATNSVGLFVTSGQYGDSNDIAIANCTNSPITSTTVAPFGSFTNTDSLKNNYTNVQLLVPNVANAFGVKLTGISSGASTTDFNTFTNVIVGMQGGANVFQVAYYLQNADTNHFINASIANFGTNTSAQCVYFDYSANNVFPSSNRFIGLDPRACGGSGTNFIVNGTPNASAKPNWVFIDEANGAVCPVLANLSCLQHNEIVFSPGGNGNSILFLPVPIAIGSLPSCGSSSAGYRATVNNGIASPTYQQSVGTTGSTTQPVFCNGNSWVYD